MTTRTNEFQTFRTYLAAEGVRKVLSASKDAAGDFDTFLAVTASPNGYSIAVYDTLSRDLLNLL